MGRPQNHSALAPARSTSGPVLRAVLRPVEQDARIAGKPGGRSTSGRRSKASAALGLRRVPAAAAASEIALRTRNEPDERGRRRLRVDPRGRSTEWVTWSSPTRGQERLTSSDRPASGSARGFGHRGLSFERGELIVHLVTDGDEHLSSGAVRLSMSAWRMSATCCGAAAPIRSRPRAVMTTTAPWSVRHFVRVTRLRCSIRPRCWDSRLFSQCNNASSSNDGSCCSGASAGWARI